MKDTTIHANHLKRYAYTDDMGYEQKLVWLEKMSKRYDQVKCPECGLFAIFERKPTTVMKDNLTGEVK